MGDHRLNVEISISLVGADGEKQSIEAWVNWSENEPSRVFDEMVEMAQKAGLPVNGFYDGEYDRLKDGDGEWIK